MFWVEDGKMEGEHLCRICSKLLSPLTEAESVDIRDQNDAIDL
ncbi:hypothetical protein A2U01_0058244, partial [Trifolium medium]|nr:hypothetical protein [Trifolium medium]